MARASLQTGMAWWMVHAGGATHLAAYGAAVAFCSLMAIPLMSPIGDRWEKPRVIVCASLALVLESAVLAAMAWGDLYSWFVMTLCGCVSAIAHAALLPAQASLLPELVSAEQLPLAIRVRRGFQASGGLAGPSLSGVMIAGGGVPAAMGLALLLALGAAAGAWTLKGRPAMTRRAEQAGWFEEMRAGFRAKWEVRLDRWWTITGALMMVFFVPATGLLLPVRLQSLSLSGAWFGACGAALSFGVLAGIAGMAELLIRRCGRASAIGWAIGICGVAIAAVGLCQAAWALVVLFAIIGLCMSVTQLVGQTHRALAVPDAFRSRMAAAQLACAHLSAAVAPALAGALLVAWPVDEVYLFMALGFVVSGAMLCIVPDLGLFLRLDHGAAKGWYGRRYPAAFIPKSRAARQGPVTKS